ncbi:MAG: CRISPR-associated endonuclease Cas1 [Elusimicrobiota bacterium]
MKKSENTKTLELVECQDPELRDFKKLNDELGQIPKNGELCLEFLTPLFFKPKSKKIRTALDTSTLIKGFERRFSRLFGTNFSYKDNEDFFVIPAYWNYTEIRHDSRSQSNAIQFINGCVGKLYLKGNFEKFSHFIILGSEIHAGNKLSNSQGYFKLHAQSIPFFSPKFPERSGLQTSIRDVIERYDQALEYLSQKEMFPFDEKKYAAKLLQELKNKNYIPSPNKTFLIKSGEKTVRSVEQLSFKDLIVAQYILRFISPIFDKLFEKESIGYRKGYSRENARRIIQKAIEDGYSYVIESDIEDFFPSVDHKLLFSLLDKYLPDRDEFIKSLIIKLITNDYILDGTLRPRLKGLPLGNPLSPLLANLYLDSFDEFIKRQDVRLVRYADDFIIICKNRNDAETLIDNTNSYLSNLGLRLNKEKTSIHPIKEGFEFLGMTFNKKEGFIKAPAKLNPFKKALYVTEPYVYISVFGDAVRIKKEGKVIQTIPLRRIEEIMVLEKTTFSTALLRKCIDYDIPLSVALNTGYYITTVKPDSKKYFAISAEHTARYNSLSGTERLSIAKCIAAAKIENYITLFKKNYKKGSHLLIQELSEYKSKAETASGINELRGFEGWTARKIYKHINILINDHSFHIKKRQRRKPDMINSLMNFSSYLLFSRINATVRALGLNPYLGFLHVPRNNYESLVSDMVELFRARIDRFLIRIVNLKIIQKKDFIKTKNGFYLSHNSAKRFLSHFENEMIKKNNQNALSLKDNIYIQSIQFRDWVTQHKSLEFYRWE